MDTQAAVQKADSFQAYARNNFVALLCCAIINKHTISLIQERTCATMQRKGGMFCFFLVSGPWLTYCFLVMRLEISAMQRPGFPTNWTFHMWQIRKNVTKLVTWAQGTQMGDRAQQTQDERLSASALSLWTADCWLRLIHRWLATQATS